MRTDASTSPRLTTSSRRLSWSLLIPIGVAGLGCGDDTGSSAALETGSSGSVASSTSEAEPGSETGSMPAEDSTDGGESSTGEPGAHECEFEPFDLDLSYDLLSVWGASADDVWIGTEGFLIGAGSYALHVQGDQVEEFGVFGTESVLEINGTATDDVWFGSTNNDGYGYTVTHWDGSEMVPYLAKSSYGLIRSIWAGSNDDVWIGGDDLLVRLEAGAFVPFSVGSAGLNETDFNGIAGTSASDVFLLGDFGTLLRWDGDRTRLSDSSSSLDTLIRPSDGPYIGLDRGNERLRLSDDGLRWDDLTVPIAEDDELRPVSFAARSAADLWVLSSTAIVPGGYRGPYVDHYDGEDWVRYDLTKPESSRRGLAIAVAGSSVWVVGTGGFAARCDRS